MKILLVAATSAEIAPLLTKYFLGQNTDSFTLGKHQVNVLITGVGMVSTAFALGQELTKNAYDLAINAGIGLSDVSFNVYSYLGEFVSQARDIATNKYSICSFHQD